MAVRLEDIARFCGQNNTPGMSADFHLIPICDVTTIPAPDTYDPDDVTPDPTLAHTISTAVTLAASKYWSKWSARKSSVTYKAEITGEEDAEQVQVTITAYLPKMTNLKTWYMNQGINGRFAVLMADRNGGDPRLIGEIDNGAKVKVTEDSNPKNGYNLEITCLMDNFPYYYSGAITPNP